MSPAQVALFSPSKVSVPSTSMLSSPSISPQCARETNIKGYPEVDITAEKSNSIISPGSRNANSVMPSIFKCSNKASEELTSVCSPESTTPYSSTRRAIVETHSTVVDLVSDDDQGEGDEVPSFHHSPTAAHTSTHPLVTKYTSPSSKRKSSPIKNITKASKKPNVTSLHTSQSSMLNFVKKRK